MHEQASQMRKVLQEIVKEASLSDVDTFEEATASILYLKDIAEDVLDKMTEDSKEEKK